MRLTFALLVAFLLSTTQAALADDMAGAQPACVTVAPARTGVRIRDESLLMGFTISATQVARQKPDENGVLVYPAPRWCAERGLTANGKQYVLWHNSAADMPKASGPFDRVTGPNGDPNSGVGTVTLVADRLAPLMRQPTDPAAPPVVYHVVVESEDKMQILASYNGPPPPEELCGFVAGGYVGINAVIEKKTNKVTIYAPQ